MRLMRHIAVAALAWLALSCAAYAQSTSPVLLPSGCGTANLGNFNNPYLTVDNAGHLCITESGSTITGNATGTTGAVVGTLAGAVGKTTFICGFNVSAIGGTAAVGPITIAGLISSSMVYQMASAAAGNTVGQTFTPCIPASATNTAITITTTADASASNVSVNSWGYQQ